MLFYRKRQISSSKENRNAEENQRYGSKIM